jgi:hypothetical protein
VEDPSKALKLTRIPENTVGKIIGIMPKSTGFVKNRVEIRTQFTGSASKFLKDVRIIRAILYLKRIRERRENFSRSALRNGRVQRGRRGTTGVAFNLLCALP